MGLRIESTIDVSKLVRAMEQGGDTDIAEAMASSVFRGSQEEVPIDTGDLKKSGRVERRDGGEAAVTYGSAKVQHALVVHEKVGINYRVGKRKYLRDPLMKGSKKHLAAGAKEMKRVLGL